MTQPPEYLLPLLIDIEKTVVEIYDEFPGLIDKDVEAVFEKLATYFKRLASNKTIAEPVLPRERQQALLEEILNTIDEREENEEDLFLINNPEIRQGTYLIPSLPHLYITAFKRLVKSSAFWRKQNGAKGYLKYISDFI